MPGLEANVLHVVMYLTVLYSRGEGGKGTAEKKMRDGERERKTCCTVLFSSSYSQRRLSSNRAIAFVQLEKRWCYHNAIQAYVLVFLNSVLMLNH